MSSEYKNVDLAIAKAAADQYSEFSLARVKTIVHAVARKAAELAGEMASQAVQETGFGVVKDKKQKNLAFSKGFLENYADSDFVSHRVDKKNSLVLFPKPAGVVFALTPSTNPVATVYHKLLSALITRNAIVISPHPGALQTCIDVVKKLNETAKANGLPDGAIQILHEPTIPLVEKIMADSRVSLILATGGGAMVKAAYKSGTPAIGVGPGNAPVLVDSSADIEVAAKSIVTSKTFDNSVLCTAESGIIVLDSVAEKLMESLKSLGGHFCTEEDVRKLQAFMYPAGKFNTDVVGKSATFIAKEAGINVRPNVKVLVVPIAEVVPEEPFTHEKLSPVIAWKVSTSFQQAVQDSKNYLSVVGEGHSAAIHTNDKQHVLDFSEAMRVHRITVNAPGSLGNAGMATYLPATMSVGTGFAGGSSSDTNFTPDQLVHWCRTTYSIHESVDLDAFSNMRPLHYSKETQVEEVGEHLETSYLRRLILEELQGLIGGGGRG